MTTSDGPIYLLTSDQDWAPPWAMHALLEATDGTPLHLFRTNPCPVADEAFKSTTITQGRHPNFLPRSNQNITYKEAITYMQQCFPGYNTARNHAYHTDTHFDRLLFEAGIRVDSQIATLWQEGLVPLADVSGTFRLPVFFEDDVFFHHHGPDLDVSSVLNRLFSPGLKVFNLHATFLACNTPSDNHYAEHRERIFGTESPRPEVIHPGRGSRTVFAELRRHVEARGGKFQCFQTLADQIIENSSRDS